MQLMINTTRDICDVTLSVYPHYIFVTSQISYSPEYTTPTQKEKKINHITREILKYSL